MKKIYKYLFKVMILALLLNSCEVDRTEAIFDESSSERIDGKIEALRAILLSQNEGFSGVYFPNNDVVGGINFHMNFTENLRVKMTSDFKSTTELTDTRYNIFVGTTAAELVFTSGSRHITDLIQDGAQGFDTFFGSNSFQYVGDEDGELTFKDIRSGGVLKLSPSGFTDFDTESVAAANITYSNKIAFSEVDCEIESVFDNLVLEINTQGETINYILNYDPDLIFFDAETTNAEGLSSRQNLGAAFTLIDGQPAISISPELKIGDIIFKDFLLENTATGEEYISTVNGATAKILKTTLSAPTGEDIAELPGSIYVYRISDGTNPLMSPCFREQVLDQVNTNLDNSFGAGTFKFSFYYLFFDFEGGCTNLAIWVENADGDTFRANYCIVANIESNTLFFDYLGPFSGPNDEFLEAELQPIIDFFSGPKGLLYTNEGAFRSSINNFINDSGAFTSLDKPSLRSYGFFFP